MSSTDTEGLGLQQFYELVEAQEEADNRVQGDGQPPETDFHGVQRLGYSTTRDGFFGLLLAKAWLHDQPDDLPNRDAYAGLILSVSHRMIAVDEHYFRAFGLLEKARERDESLAERNPFELLDSFAPIIALSGLAQTQHDATEFGNPLPDLRIVDAATTAAKIYSMDYAETDWDVAYALESAAGSQGYLLRHDPDHGSVGLGTPTPFGLDTALSIARAVPVPAERVYRGANLEIQTTQLQHLR